MACLAPLLLLRGAGAEEAPTAPPPSAEERAQEVGRALAAGRAGDLGAWARDEEPDPWEVLDELRARGDAAGARAWVAAAGPTSDLPRGPEATAPGAVDPEATAHRAALREALARPAREQEGRLAALDQALEPARGRSPRRAARVAWARARAHAASRSPAEQEEAVWQRARELAADVGWRAAEVAALRGLAEAQRARDAHAEALATLRDAAWVAEPHLDRPFGPRTLHALAYVAAYLDVVPEARRASEDAALAYERLGLLLPATDCWTMSAMLGSSAGDVTRAWSSLRRAAELLDEVAPRGTSVEAPRQARIELRFQESALFELLGMPERALALQTELLAEARSMPRGAPALVALLLANRARAQFLQGEADQARRDGAEAYARFVELGQEAAAWQCLAACGWFEVAGSVDAEVVARLEDALRRPGEPLPPATRSLLREALARCRAAQGRWPAAVESLQEALTDADEAEGSESARLDLLGGLAWALGGSGRDADCVSACRRYVDGLVGRVDGLECSTARTFRGLVLQQALGAGLEAARRRGDLASLWSFLEAGRGIRLLSGLGGRSRLYELLLPAEQRARREALIAQERAARQRRREAREQRLGLEELQRRTREVEAVVLARQQQAAEALRAPPEGVAGELGGSVDLATLPAVQRALARDEALVAYVWRGPRPVWALVLTSAAARLVELGQGGALEGEILALRAAASAAAEQGPGEGAAARAAELEARLARLRALLVEPLELPAALRHVAVLPEGPLSTVPFTALLGTRGPDVTLQNSGSLLLWLKGRSARRGQRRLALGITDYDGRATGDDLSLALFPASGDVAAARGLRRLGRLPSAAAEARAVAEGRGQALVDGEATAAGLLRAIAASRGQPLQTVHFAVHGITHPTQPSLSGLALTDGLLTAQEVVPLRLQTDLVVLSACDTGTDPYGVGDGVSGLVRSFLLAGAPRVVASLWKVPDAPTAELMRALYAALDRDPRQAPVTALRSAQERVRTMDGGRWASAECWAGWVLWGAR